MFLSNSTSYLSCNSEPRKQPRKYCSIARLGLVHCRFGSMACEIHLQLSQQRSEVSQLVQRVYTEEKTAPPEICLRLQLLEDC